MPDARTRSAMLRRIGFSVGLPHRYQVARLMPIASHCCVRLMVAPSGAEMRRRQRPVPYGPRYQSLVLRGDRVGQSTLPLLALAVADVDRSNVSLLQLCDLTLEPGKVLA